MSETSAVTPATTLQVLVHDEHGVVFSGQAHAISSINEQGPFDILPDHTNFITLISQSLTIHDASGTAQQFTVDGGIIHCFTSQVEIYLGITDKRRTPTSQNK